jgi:hypothetical protein
VMIFVNETSKLHYQGIDQLLQKKSPKFISACRRACMMLAQKGFTEKREKSCFLILSEPSPPDDVHNDGMPPRRATLWQSRTQSRRARRCWCSRSAHSSWPSHTLRWSPHGPPAPRPHAGTRQRGRTTTTPRR